MSENINYGSYPQNVYFYDLPIEHKHRLFTKLSIHSLTGSIVERFKVSLIEQSLVNRIYKINPQISNFDYLPFDGYGR